MEKIVVPQIVRKGVEAVRKSGHTYMLDYNTVAKIAKAKGFVETADWIHDHKREYIRGLFYGFIATSDK